MAYISKQDRLVKGLMDLIANGKPGDKLPSYRSLSVSYDIGLSTVNRTIAMLRALGKIEGRPGNCLVIALRDTEPVVGGKVATIYRELTALCRDLGPGAKLPSYGELAQQFKCSSATINRTIYFLRMEGRVVGRQGEGTYVAQIDK